LRELQNFKHYLTKRGNAYKHNNVEKMLEVYSWFVLPEYRNKGLYLLNNLSQNLDNSINLNLKVNIFERILKFSCTLYYSVVFINSSLTLILFLLDPNI